MVVTSNPINVDTSDGVLGVASDVNSNFAVTFCECKHGLPLESLSSTRMCVWWLAVVDCRPGPLTWYVYYIKRVGGG